MFGAIIGDIVGSRFNGNVPTTKDFELFDFHCSVTGNSVMSLAICNALLKNHNEEYVPYMLENLSIRFLKKYCRRSSNRGYDKTFLKWIKSNKNRPYDSFDNNAALRVSACGFVANSLEQAESLSERVTAVSHKNIESIAAAQAISSAIFLARYGRYRYQIKDYIENFWGKIDFKVDDVKDDHIFISNIKNTVPLAFESFFEAVDFEDAIRIAVSLGGVSSNIASITGALAEAFFGVPSNIRKSAGYFLNYEFLEILSKFEEKYGAPEPHYKLDSNCELNEKKRLIENSEVEYKIKKREYFSEKKINELRKDLSCLFSLIDPIDNALKKAPFTIHGPMNYEEKELDPSLVRAFLNAYYDFADKHIELCETYDYSLEIFRYECGHPIQINAEKLSLKESIHFLTFAARAMHWDWTLYSLVENGFLQSILRRIKYLLNF